MKKTFITAVMALSALTMNAQDVAEFGLFDHVGLGIEVGTTGIGIQVAAPINDHIQVRAGYNFLPNIKVKNIGVDISSNKEQWEEIMKNANQLQAYDQNVANFYNRYGNASYPNDLLIDGKLNANNFKLLVDLYPSKYSTFHFTAGFYVGSDKFVEANTTNCQDQLGAIAFYNENLANKKVGSYTFGDKIGAKLGDYLIEPEVDEQGNGYANASIKVNSFKPYLGIGFGRAVPKGRLSVAMDLGVQFWGSPKIYVGDKQIEETSGLGGSGGIVKTLSNIIVYPCLSIRLNGRIF